MAVATMIRPALRRGEPQPQERNASQGPKTPGWKSRAEDRREQREAKRHCCPCGCGTTDRRQLQWFYLTAPRQCIANRSVFTMPLCQSAQDFLEEHPRCVAELRDLATRLDRRLTAADVRPVLERFGYRREV